METKRFQRREEDFVCEHCGVEVSGNGFTNHCPRCLWSKHVDIHPGDREADCGGLMEPVSATLEGGEYFLIQRCQKCPHERRNKISTDDDFDAVVAVSVRVGG